MPTSKLDRLNQLFEGDERIARPDPSKPHIADIDFMSKASINKQATPNLAQAEEPWKIPVVNQYPRETTPPPPPAGRDLDLLTSSDEDEYVAAFSSKPNAKEPQTKSRRRGSQERALRDSLNASPRDLADHDVEGNPLIGHFCPLALVAKFPYKYIVDTDGRISRHFFAENKFYQRTWDVYYIDSLGSTMTKHILLLPLDQVKHLIDQINLAFNTTIVCPPDPFTVSFFNDGMPQPKHLGISRSRDDLTDMKASIPTVSDDYVEDFSQVDGRPTERTCTAFKAKIERIISSTKKNKQAAGKKRQAAKQKKLYDRFLRQQDWVKQLKRAQRYLGLRPRATQIPVPNSAAPRAEQQKLRDQDLRAGSVRLDPLDTSKPAPYVFESDPVIVCVDVEAYERDHSKVTEIGVSTLDTLDLAGVAVGDGGENWIAHIRSRHFRIRGREHLENKDFCSGNANNFQFGKSEWVTLDSAAEAVDQCFEYPFSVQFRPRHLPAAISPLIQTLSLRDPGNAAENATGKVAVSQILHHGQPDNGMLSTNPGHQPATLCYTDGQKGPRKRNVIFLGHDIRNEFEYLSQLGSQIFGPSSSTHPISKVEMNAGEVGRNETLGSIIEALDTAVLYRALLRDGQTQSLGKMMVGLGRTAWHLHNAGNDARYTLEALVALLIKTRTLEDEATRLKEPNNSSDQHADTGATAPAWKAEGKHRVAEKADAMEHDVRHEPKEWEKALHTMKITDNSGKQIEVEDPWLMAQESDQELSQSQGVKEKENWNWVAGVDDTRKPIYCGPAATGWQYEFTGSADAMDGGEADEGGVAKMVKEGASGKKKGRIKGERRGSGDAKGDTKCSRW